MPLGKDFTAFNMSRTDATPRPSGWHLLLWIILAAAAVGLGVALGVPALVRGWLQQGIDWTATLGAWKPVVFVVLYTIACVAVLPASVLTVGAGVIFETYLEAVIYVCIGAILGATAAFLTGRYLARDWVRQKMAAHPSFSAIDQAVTAEGWRIVLLTRLCPLFPFFLMNYAYGITRVSLRHYVLATCIGIIPGSSLFVWFGHIARTSVTGNASANWIKTAFILLTALVSIVYLTKVSRRILVQKTSSPEDRPVPPRGK